MLQPIRASALLLLAQQLFAVGTTAAPEQVVFAPRPGKHVVDPAILHAIKIHPDPVDALISLQPELADELARPRLLHVYGEKEAQWMTEGDKLRLRRKGRKFADITDFEDFYAKQDTISTMGGKAHVPGLIHQRLVKPLAAKVSTRRMHDDLEELTSFYTRYFGSVTGEQSAQWIYDHLAEIIRDSPFHTHISLEFFPHPFPQPSIIARFEPKVRDFSKPLTILGAHQDSANYLFPLLPAPGADDDCSGTVSNLEAFRILAQSGYTPANGPVEFHWYAGEEGGNLGSQAVARYKKESGTTIGAMLEFDMVAFLARNSTESIGLIDSNADAALVNWTVSLAKEYSEIPAKVYTLPDNSSSDYASYTKLGYPAAFATEGDPVAGGFPGEYDPYIHGEGDTMDVNDETGTFSLDHMAHFTKLAIAFVVEQAGWDNAWR